MTDRELISACRKLISQYGTLRYCRGGICACLGCVNRTLTKEQYEYALTLPEVKVMMEGKEKPPFDIRGLLDHIKRREERKNGKSEIESRSVT